jgi:hypothetical protein
VEKINYNKNWSVIQAQDVHEITLKKLTNQKNKPKGSSHDIHYTSSTSCYIDRKENKERIIVTEPSPKHKKPAGREQRKKHKKETYEKFDRSQSFLNNLPRINLPEAQQ